jgi:hypothetical protein
LADSDFGFARLAGGLILANDDWQTDSGQATLLTNLGLALPNEKRIGSGQHP